MSEPPVTEVDRVVLWVRSLSPDEAGPRRTRAIDRLQTLADRGRIADPTVRLWGERIRPNTPEARTRPGRQILDRVAAFRSWAREEDRSLRPFVQDRRRGGETEVLLPTMTLAEYREGTLAFVSPCSDGEEGHTVFDRIDALAGDRRDAGTVAPPPVPNR